MQARIVATLSQHPLATHAVGECAGELLESGGPNPDLLLLAVTPPHAGALEDVLHATRALLAPRVQLGVTSDRLLAGAREVNYSAALSMCAIWFSHSGQNQYSGGHTATTGPQVQPVRLSGAVNDIDEIGLQQLRGATGTLILLADPSLLETKLTLDKIAQLAPGLSIVGGSAGPSRNQGATRLCLHNSVYANGMVGALISHEVETQATTSQGCRPFGAPLTATRAERNVIYELDGRHALEVTQELLATIALENRSAARDSLRIGVLGAQSANREQVSYFGVLGADKAAESIMIGVEIEQGATIQFALRDSTSASADLIDVLSELPATRAAFAFSAGSRAADFFGRPHHEALLISEALDPAALWGISCFDCFGAQRGAPRLHSQAVSLLVFPEAGDAQQRTI